MVCLEDGARIHVPRGGVIRLRDGEGTAVRCVAGAIWITLEQDERDIVLKPGENFVIDRGGLSLVCAIAGPVELVIDHPTTIVADNAARPGSHGRRDAGADLRAA